MIDIGLLKDRSHMKRFQKGQIIIEDGETMCDEMYILLKGTAGIFKNYQESGELKIADIKPGDFFGEMTLFLNKERTATVVANEEVIALTINRMNAYEFFEKQPEATYSLIKTLCSRLDSSNIAYNKLYNETHPEIAEAEEAALASLRWLFPNGHKLYRRPINSSKVNALAESSYRCPLCGHSFTAFTVTQSGEEPTYKCIRPARGMDDFYYDVITCPNCWCSVFANQFNRVRQENISLFEAEMNSSKSVLNDILNEKKGVAGVFAGYYLALKCAPRLFTQCEETKARLWIRLSWLYYDCKDEKFEQHAVKSAQEAYIAAFEKREIPADQLALAHFAVGELSFKAGDWKNAKQYFGLAKNSLDKPELKRQAEECLDDVQQRLNESISMMRTTASRSE